MSRVFLVNPSNTTIGYSFITPRWLYVLAQATPRDLVGEPVLIDESISRFDPAMVEPGDIVGIGITTGNCNPGYRVLREAKARGAKVIMGGIHATIFPDEPLEMQADAVVTGGGDVVWAEAVRDALENKLRTKYVGGQVPGEQLLPARWDLLNPRKYMFASVQTVAGCPENCSFCSVWVTDGRRPRQRLTDNIITEVSELYRRGFRYIIFADDNFNPATIGRIEREESPAKKKELAAVREQRLKFFDEYDKAVPKDMYAFTQMTSEVVSDPEYLTAMYEKMRIRAGLIGVESFSVEGLKCANKQWNPVGDKMVETIRTIQKKGIFVLSSIICGLESDTTGTIATMREFAKASGSLLAQFTVYSPFPGTVDFLEMMQDRKAAAKGNGNGNGNGDSAVAPKHRAKILNDRFWILPKRPPVLIEHLNLDSETLVKEVQKSWSSFYKLPEVVKRAKAQTWPLSGKIWFVLASLGFRSLYAGYGISADAVKTKKLSFIPSILLRAAVSFYNGMFRKPVAN